MYLVKPKELIFDEYTNDNKWLTFTDEVIGGLSTGDALQHDNYVEFKGKLRPSYGKRGWCALRSPKGNHDLEDYKFIEIKIKTDGKPYHFQLEYDLAWQGEKLSTKIDIVSNQWKVMHIEMSDLKLFDFKNGYLDRKPKLGRKLPYIHHYNIVACNEEKADFNFQIEYVKFH